MALLTADFELGVNGNDILVADAGSANAWDTRGVSGGTLKYSSTQKAHGSLSAQFDHTASAATKKLAWDTSLGGTITDHYGRFYLFFTALPTADTYLWSADTNGVTNNALIRLLATGALRTAAKGGVILNTTAAILSINTWYRIEYHVIHSATVGQVELKLFAGDNSAPIETVTSAANKDTNATANQISFGATQGTGGAWIQYMDDILGNAAGYPGPSVSPGGVAMVDQTAEILLLTRPH